MPELDLWLDPHGPKPHAFVSHAHADHFARHESVICSETTASLLKHRYDLAPERIQALGFHTPLVIGNYRLRLLPAGHITGSAMLHVTRSRDNATLLYTGDFKTRRSRTAEAVNFLSADTLVMETTFGLPHYRFPNAMEVEAEVLGFVHDCFADGVTPILLGYSLGKAQEALALLHEHGIPALLHPAAASMTEACRAVGLDCLPEPVVFTGELPEGHVIITPPHALKSKLFRSIPAKRTAMLSGWALQPNSKFRYGVDAMIPFSDHADYPGLLECIQRVRPRRVFTVHGFSKEFAADLRAHHRIHAWCAGGGDQLELPIQQPKRRPAASSRAGWHSRVLCPLADFSDLCRLLEKTGSRTNKIEFVANYFKGLEQDEDLKCAANWLGSPVARRGDSRLNPKTLRHALLAIPGTREERYHEILQILQDDILTAVNLLQEVPLQPEGMNLAQAAGFIADFQQQRGTIDWLYKLSERLITLHPAESETLLKLIVGNLRLGMDRALIQESISKAFDTPLDAIRKSGLGLGESAVMARHKQLAGNAGPLKI